MKASRPLYIAYVEMLMIQKLPPNGPDTQYKKLISKLDRRTLLTNSNYRLNHAIVVKFYEPYTQFPHDVRLYHRRIATFSLLRLVNTLTYVLISFLLITIYESSVQ